MTAKYYASVLGRYLGAFDGAAPPDGSIEVPVAPADASMMWDGKWDYPAATFYDRRAAVLTTIASTANTLLATGAPVSGGLHIALDDGSRADLTAMAATATAASAGAVTWPESYSRGWIAIENVRLPLATPAAGLTLAASVGNWYAAVVQHRRDLKDAALAAVSVDALDAIDIEHGWPT